MSALKVLIWGFLPVLGTVALTFLTGLFHPDEKVNGLWFGVAAACNYMLAYRFHGCWITKALSSSTVRVSHRVTW